MKIDNRYKYSGIGLGILFVGATTLSLRKYKRDKKTSLLLEKIQSKIGSSNKLLGASNAFDINYLDKVLQQVSNTVVVIKKEVAVNHAKQIYKAWGSWYQGGDDEAKVYAVFRSLSDKVQVAQVAKAYQSLYSVNLIDVLKERLSSSEIKQVLQIVERLPNYRNTIT